MERPDADGGDLHARILGPAAKRTRLPARRRRWSSGRRRSTSKCLGTGSSRTTVIAGRRSNGRDWNGCATWRPRAGATSLSDKVWRDDVLAVAWQAVRRNGGAAGVDGETVADIESTGVNRWLGALARNLKAGTYQPRAVRQVLIPKKQRGKFRPLGIPAGPPRARRGQARAPAAEHGPPGGGRRRPVGLLRSNPARGLDAVHRPARERRTAAGLGQGVAGNGSGGGRRARRSPPHEPGASRAEGNPARVSDFAAVQQRLHASRWKVLDYARRFEAEIVNYADDCAPRRRGKEAEMAT